MKILFTSVGRRVELVQCFKDAAKRLDINLDIIGADATESAPALFFCDKRVQTPLIADANYVPFLVSYCMAEKVDMVIPTIDTDLLKLAENIELFGRTKVLVSSPQTVEICRDKRLTANFFGSIGLKTPQTCDDYLNYQYGFPAFIKPIDGSSSINTFAINSREELDAIVTILSNYIVQPLICGTEYTVDVFCDYEGNPLLVTPRIRLAVRAGEVLKTKIDLDQTIIDEVKLLVAKLKPCGPITIQLIRDSNTGEDYYLEINPRFGGGAPLSIKAGADSATLTLALLNGEDLKDYPYKANNGLIFSRFDQSIEI